MEVVKLLVTSFFFTVLFEVTVAWIHGIRKKKDVLLVILVNLITNPVVVFCYYFIAYVIPYQSISSNPILRNEWSTKIILEMLAILCEAFYYKRYLKTEKHPFRLSLFLNVVSFGIGCFVA